MGWNLFAHQNYVHADLHILRETHATSILGRLAEMRAHIEDVRGNPRFDAVLWVIQGGWKGVNGNLLVGCRLLPSDTPILRYVNQAERGAHVMPSNSFIKGVTHGAGTLTDAVNLAYLGGWRRIVLIGVDLYDSRYFAKGAWEDDPAWRASSDPAQTHRTAQFGIVNQMEAWQEWLTARGVGLYVQNPRSLLAQFLPIYDWREAEHGAIR